MNYNAHVVDNEIAELRTLLLKMSLFYKVFECWVKHEARWTLGTFIVLEVVLPAALIAVTSGGCCGLAGWGVLAIRLCLLACCLFAVVNTSVSRLNKKRDLRNEGEDVLVLRLERFEFCFWGLGLLAVVALIAISALLLVHELTGRIPELYKWALMATLMSVGLVYVSQFVGLLYVPLRRIPYVDIVCVSRTIQSVGWALWPAAMVLIVVQASRGHGTDANGDSVGRVVSLLVPAITSLATFIRRQGRWLDDFSKTRMEVENNLDDMMLSLRDEIKAGRIQGGVNDLLPSDKELSDLTHFVRSGVSLSFYGYRLFAVTPLIPVENWSLFLAVIICRWPQVAQVLLKAWGSELRNEWEAAGDAAREEVECVASRLMGEFMNLPRHQQNSIRKAVEDVSQFIELRGGGRSSWRECVAADVLVRETIVARGVVVR